MDILISVFILMVVIAMVIFTKRYTYPELDDKQIKRFNEGDVNVVNEMNALAASFSDPRKVKQTPHYDRLHTKAKMTDTKKRLQVPMSSANENVAPVSLSELLEDVQRKGRR